MYTTCFAPAVKTITVANQLQHDNYCLSGPAVSTPNTDTVMCQRERVKKERAMKTKQRENIEGQTQAESVNRGREDTLRD